VSNDADVAEEAVERSKDETGSDTESSGAFVTVSATSNIQAVKCFCLIMKSFVRNF